MRTFKKINGFTLVEMIIIIGLIGVIVSGMIILIDPATQLAKGRDGQRNSDLRTIQTALELFRADNSNYPIFSDGAGGAKEASEMDLSNSDNISYLRTIPTSPNGTSCDYVYAVTDSGSEYTIYTMLENDSEKSDAAIAKPSPATCDGSGGTSCTSDNITASISCGGSNNTYNYWVNSP